MLCFVRKSYVSSLVCLSTGEHAYFLSFAHAFLLLVIDRCSRSVILIYHFCDAVLSLTIHQYSIPLICKHSFIMYVHPTHQCMYRAMRRYLCQVFSMSLSSLPCPLEFFIASVVGQVPLPVAGGR